jgi:hypothetical protein
MGSTYMCHWNVSDRHRIPDYPCPRKAPAVNVRQHISWVLVRSSIVNSSSAQFAIYSLRTVHLHYVRVVHVAYAGSRFALL